MGQPTIYKPSVYNGNGVYKNGASGGGGGGGPQYTENIVLLLNGVTDTSQPISGSVTPSIDNDFPLENLKVFSSANCASTGVYYEPNIPIDNIFTLDFWFKGISHSFNITPFFIGLSRLNLNDYMLSTNYNDDLTNFLWAGWITGLNRFVMQKGIWHHLCVESRPVDASHDERFLFVDGQMKKHSLSVSGINWNELKLNFGGGYNKTLYEIGQICIRNSIVWEQDFTPPNYAYSLY